MIAPALSATGITADYGGRPVLNNVDIALKSGEAISLIGHNGAGKSTLLKVLFGLHQPSAGTISLNGVSLQPQPKRMNEAGVAYLPEGKGVFPSLSVKEIFALAVWSAGIEGKDAEERTNEVIALLPRIREFWLQRAGTLSGGQQQMVSIARVLLLRPTILLLDEPSIGLAPKLFEELLGVVRRIQLERRMSIILVEQNIREAFRNSDRVVVLRAGRFIFDGLPSELSDETALMKMF